MGSATSKFKKYVQNGDEFAAMQIHQSSPEVRKNLDPNLSYGEGHHHNTPMHYAAAHGMKHLLRIFVSETGGNPNKRNSRNETVLHSACTLGSHRTYSAEERRAACTSLLLNWKGPSLTTTTSPPPSTASDQRERVDLNSRDVVGNTALHKAAAHGLYKCVQLLVAAGIDIFAENNDRQTACDVAMKCDNHPIARYLEAKMVFGERDCSVNESESGSTESEEGSAGGYTGLRSQELREAKDQLLVETSDMLGVQLFTAEALLRDNEWSRESLLERWVSDPAECCTRAGLPFPPDSPGHSHLSSVCLLGQSPPSSSSDTESLCGICLSPLKTTLSLDCGHKFCRECWATYLTSRIQDGESNLMCPASACNRLVCPQVLEGVVSPTVAQRYLQFDIKAFVEENKAIKWCPRPDCGQAVKLPLAASLTQTFPHNVDCGEGHFFCWECLGEAHAPASCTHWRSWLAKVWETRPEERFAEALDAEETANVLWLVTNSKPCPNCKSPIQKNDGCNHMRCTKCKYDFCWVCMESWKKHSSTTGGYFRCNRYEAVQKADQQQGLLITEAAVRNEETIELNRFLHYYTRFKNHDNSRKMEESLLKSASRKMQLLASGNKEKDLSSVKFIEDGAKELLKSRRVLSGSYVYGYYLQDNGFNRSIFEFMQNELETETEKLSEMLARPYLRSPKSAIVQATQSARRRRQDLTKALAKPSSLSLICSELASPSSLHNNPSYSQMDKSTSYQNVAGDEEMELVIALEMSRLQMIEDRVKKRLREESMSSQDSNGLTEAELDWAIELSLSSSAKAGKTHEDFTMDGFLKNLASIDLNQRVALLQTKPLRARDVGGETGEEGRFQIGEVHTSGRYCPPLAEERSSCLPLARRSRSTSDISKISESRYHLDSDHSSSHEERAEEEAVRRLLGSVHQESSLDSASDTGNSQEKEQMQAEKEDTGTEIDTGERSGVERLGGIGKQPAVQVPDSQLLDEGENHLYISGVSISRTPEPQPTVLSGGTETGEESQELSSILHVEERNLSSEDFHEAFFLSRKRSRRRSRRGEQVGRDSSSAL